MGLKKLYRLSRELGNTYRWRLLMGGIQVEGGRNGYGIWKMSVEQWGIWGKASVQLSITFSSKYCQKEP